MGVDFGNKARHFLHLPFLLPIIQKLGVVIDIRGIQLHPDEIERGGWFAPEQKWLRDFALAPVNIPDDSIFGCWCHPQLCHGDIVAGYINWKRHQYVEFRQREALRKRLVGRKKPSREVFEEIGAPRLFE